jgi:predicted nucleic acid-binding protein
MATRGDSAFVDTNVLLRALTPQLELHAEANTLLRDAWAKGDELWISRQVIREYLAQVTRPQAFTQPLSGEQLAGQVQTIEALFRVADDTLEVTTQPVALLREYPTGGKQVHDANIVATMLVNGIDCLFTANVADMRRFADKITLIPLVAARE